MRYAACIVYLTIVLKDHITPARLMIGGFEPHYLSPPRVYAPDNSVENSYTADRNVEITRSNMFGRVPARARGWGTGVRLHGRRARAVKIL